MAAPQVSSQFMDDMGPLAAMFAGRNQGLAENTEMTSQQNMLEQIANSQQTRDIAQQKLPYELSALQHKQALQPGELVKQDTENKSALNKLDKEKFDTFYGQFKDTLPTLTGGPADVAILHDVAKKNGMDPEDPRIKRMIETVGSGNQQAISEMMKRIALMSEKSIQERTKQGEQDAAHLGRTREEIAGRERVANIQADASMYGADQRAAAALARAGQLKQTIDQQIAGLEAQMAEAEPNLKQGYANRIAYLTAIKKEIASATQERRTDDLERLLANLQQGASAANTAAPQAPAAARVPATGPGAAPPGAAPAPQQAQPAQAGQPRVVGTTAMTKGGEPVWWDGKGWVRGTPPGK